MKWSNLTAGLAAALLVSGIVAHAQELTLHSQELTVQGSGVFTKDSNSNGINQHTDNSPGILLNYRYFFTRSLAVEASYGWSRHTSQRTNSFGVRDLESNVHQASGALVFKLPWTVARLHPFALSGAAALSFHPSHKSGSYIPGATKETKPAFMYGGGADYYFNRHLLARFEYRGFVYGRPDFGLNSLHTGATVHTAQPSIGFGVRF